MNSHPMSMINYQLAFYYMMQQLYNNDKLRQTLYKQEKQPQEEITIKIEQEEESELKKQFECKVEEEQSSNISQQSKKIQRKAYHIFPGETKNYYKNIGQKIANYIVEQFGDVSSVMEDSAVRSFLKIDSQKYNRLSIQKLLKSRIGRHISKYFFGNFTWCVPFLVQHKTELDLYFRHNCMLYTRKNKSVKQEIASAFKKSCETIKQQEY